MNSFQELKASEAEELIGGAPTSETSFFYDVFYAVSFTGHLLWDSAVQFGAGASEGGYAYAKTGLK